jgi:hypothetical protein
MAAIPTITSPKYRAPSNDRAIRRFPREIMVKRQNSGWLLALGGRHPGLKI